MGEIKLNTLTGIRILPQNQDNNGKTVQPGISEPAPGVRESFGLKTDFALKRGIDDYPLCVLS